MGATRSEVLRRLRRHVVSGVHLQTLRLGDRLPSIRELAAEWDADPRTIRWAYEALRREGIVEMRPRSGVYVALPHPGAELILPQMAEWIVGVLLQARDWGIAPVAYPERVRRCLETLRLRAACVECNDDQIQWLVHEARTDYGLDSFAVDLGRSDGEELLRTLSPADVIITTAFHGEELSRIAAELRKPVVIIRLHESFVEQTTRSLRQGPLYFVVADRRFAEKLPMIYDSMVGSANLRTLVAGEEDPSSIPDGAAVYVTRAARQQLGSFSHPGLLPPVERVFCDSTAAELLRIIVQTNISAMRHATTALYVPPPG